jgi:hypothetical protein
VSYNYFWRSYKSKKAILFFVFFVIFFVKISSVFAEINYDIYRTLFNSKSLEAVGMTRDTTKKSLTGLLFKFSYSLGDQQRADGSWKYISDDEPFVVRVCKQDDAGKIIKDSCGVSAVPYVNGDTSIGQDILTSLIDFASFASNPGVFLAVPSQAEINNATKVAEYNSTANKKSIYRTDGSGVFTKAQEILFGVHDLSKSYPQAEGSTVEGSIESLYNFSGKETTLDVSIWYCGDGLESGDVPSSMISDLDMRSFGPNFCDTSSVYFKIASTKFVIPKSYDDATAQGTFQASNENIQGITATQPTQASGNEILPACDILNGYRPAIAGGDVPGTFMGCMAQVAYGIYWVFNWMAGVMGNLFDFFLGYSLDSDSYQASFITEGWKIVRDISNIFFIIILVWTGFSTALGISSLETLKKVVPTLIINALLINFSLFGTKLIIDLSNIVARVFYTSMQVCSGACNDKDNPTNVKNGDRTKGGVGYTPLSEKIVSAFDPQRIFAPSVLDPKNVTGPAKSGNLSVGDKKEALLNDANSYAIYFMIISLIAAAIMISMIVMFWKVAFIFLGRVIGLYIVMIFAPFAVMTRGDMPIVSKVKELKWDTWWGELTQYAILAPVFVFFLYIVYKFIDSDFLKIFDIQGFSDTASFLTVILSVTVPMLIVFFMLRQSADIAKSFSGKVGGMVSNFIEKGANVVGGLAVGGAVGLATGGVALVGTRLGSRAAKAVGNTGLGKWAAQSNSWAARKTRDVLNASQTGSWDLRKTTIGGVLRDNTLYSQMGLKVSDKISSRVGLGEAKFEGGFKGQQKRRKEEISKNIANRTKVEFVSEKSVKEIMQKRIEEKTLKNIKSTTLAAESYLKKTDAEFVKRKDQEKINNDDIKELNKKIDAEKEKLDPKNGTLTAEQRQFSENRIAELGKLVKDKKESNEKIASLNLTAVEDVKKNPKKMAEGRSEADYKKAYDDEKKRLEKKYGKVESGEDLSNVLKLDYAQELKDNSFWMHNGKQRAGLWGIGTGYGANATAIGGLLAGVSNAVTGGAALVAGAIGGEMVAFEQEALDSATKGVINGWKNKSHSNKIEELKAEVESYKDKIKEVVGKAINKDKKEVNDTDLESADKHLDDYVDDLYVKVEAAKEDLDQAKKEMRSAKGTPDEKTKMTAWKEARKKHRGANDLYQEYSDIQKDKKSAENKLKDAQEKKSREDAKKQK